MRGFAIALVAIATCVAPAHADYVRIGPGPSLDYAKAYCDNAAMGAPQPGMFVYGNQAFVGGAMLGYGLGSLIRRERFKQNCMVMQGWKWKKSADKSGRGSKAWGGSNNH